MKFCWVPSHVGVSGNERADAAAKAATRLSHISNLPTHIDDFRNAIRFYRKDHWQAHWTNLDNNFKLKSIRPSVQSWSLCQVDRRSSIVLTRLRIGHTNYTHRYLMASGAERQAPRCPTCQVEVTVEHILVSCPVFGNKRRINFLANKSLKDILDENAPVEYIIKFLKDINIFYDL